MNILNISNEAGNKGGGISEVVHAYLKYNNNLKFSSELWFPGGNAVKNIVKTTTNCDIKKLNSLFSIGPARFGICPTLFFKKKYALKSFDLIHQHGVWLPLSIFTSAASKKVKTVISPHGLLEPDRLAMSAWKKKISRKLYEDRNLNNCSCLVACSEQEARGFRKFGLMQPIVIIPNGISDDWFNKPSNTKNNVKAKYQIPSSSKVLLFLSRLHPLKGLELVISNINKIKDQFRSSNWVFVIAGKDEINYKSKLEKLIANYNLNDIIKIIPPQYGEDKFDLFNSASFFILPSKNENFGIVIIEALARGIPVITTKNTPWKELSETKSGFWIERTDNVFEEYLLKIINLDDKILNLMGENGKKLVMEKYLWSQIAKQNMEMYKWVLNDFIFTNSNGLNIYNE